MEAKAILSNMAPSLSKFPYFFSGEGKLYHKHTGQPYVFKFSCHDVQNTLQEQATLCDFIRTYLHLLLEYDMRLQKVFLPDNNGFVFMSTNALQKKDALMVLIPGMGTINCGMWSWKTVVREGLNKGSQIPYVLGAQREGWSVLLMNPNDDSESPEEHVCHVWDYYISQTSTEHLVIVAHGYGGLAFVDLLCRRPKAVESRVTAVAFIDSSHNVWHQPLGVDERGWLRSHSKHWVLSTKPLNGPVGTIRAGKQLSAGTLCHDYSPVACIEAVFQYLTKAIKPRATPVPFSIVTRSQNGVGQKFSSKEEPRR